MSPSLALLPLFAHLNFSVRTVSQDVFPRQCNALCLGIGFRFSGCCSFGQPGLVQVCPSPLLQPASFARGDNLTRAHAVPCRIIGLVLAILSGFFIGCGCSATLMSARRKTKLTQPAPLKPPLTSSLVRRQEEGSAEVVGQDGECGGRGWTRLPQRLALVVRDDHVSPPCWVH